MNHFMARLIFCFFAEDTGILHYPRPNELGMRPMQEHAYQKHCEQCQLGFWADWKAEPR
jgi:hypothetical protein